MVLVDSPALSAVSDALALVPKISGVLVVGALGHTTRDAAHELRKQLILARGNALGVVANFTPSERGYRYYYGSPHPRIRLPERLDGDAARRLSLIAGMVLTEVVLATDPRLGQVSIALWAFVALGCLAVAFGSRWRPRS